jgi:hypothetical protein
MMGKIKAMFQTTSYCFSSNIKSPANSKKKQLKMLLLTPSLCNQFWTQIETHSRSPALIPGSPIKLSRRFNILAISIPTLNQPQLMVIFLVI